MPVGVSTDVSLQDYEAGSTFTADGPPKYTDRPPSSRQDID